MSSNIGQTGVSSIRLKGQRVEELPLGTGNEAKEQLVLAQETERLNRIATISAEYPHQRVDWLASRINECEANKQRMRKMIGETHGRIQEYRGLIMQTDMRDKLLADEDDAAKRKELYKHWGRWDADALRQQIEQDKEALDRFEDVIDQEDASIKELTETIALCRERDKKLAALGAVTEGS